MMRKMLPILAISLLLLSFCAAWAAEPPCWLLRDPVKRGIMSAALETRLMRLCGEEFPAGWSESGATIPFAHTGKAGDVQINDILTDPTPYTTQSECTVAVRASDGTLVAAWNDSTHYYTGDANSFVGYGYSTDGGLTWTDGGTPSPASPFTTFGGDPDMRADSNGYFYFSTMAGDGTNTGLANLRSTDGGMTFEPPVVVHAGPADDKVLEAIDTTGGAHDGNIYVCALDMNITNDFGVFCAASTDGGATFGAPVSVCPTCGYLNSQAPFPVVGPAGDLYVAWLTWPDYPNTGQIQISKSSDGGASFTKLSDATEAFPLSKFPNATFFCGRPALKGPLRYNDFPSMAVGPDGAIHIVYSRHGAGNDSADVMYVRSGDDGATWSTPFRLVDDGSPTDNFFPTIVSNPDGKLVAYWYDRREDATNAAYKIYATRSNDGGLTWSANEAVSDTASPVYSGGDGLAQCYMGDYNKGSADSDFAYVIWSDQRNTQDGHPDPDVWFHALDLGAPTTTMSTSTTTTTTTTTTEPPATTTVTTTTSTTSTTAAADDDTGDDTAVDDSDDDWHDDDSAAPDDTSVDDDSGDDTGADVSAGGDDSSKNGGCGC